MQDVGGVKGMKINCGIWY